MPRLKPHITPTKIGKLTIDPITAGYFVSIFNETAPYIIWYLGYSFRVFFPCRINYWHFFSFSINNLCYCILFWLQIFNVFFFFIFESQNKNIYLQEVQRYTIQSNGCLYGTFWKKNIFIGSRRYFLNQTVCCCQKCLFNNIYNFPILYSNHFKNMLAFYVCIY